MNIGFVNIFSFRPHVEHLNFLQAVLKKSGHDTFFLTCDSSVSNCYAQAIKGSRKLGGTVDLNAGQTVTLSGGFPEDVKSFVLYLDGAQVKRGAFNNKTKQFVPVAIGELAEDAIKAA